MASDTAQTLCLIHFDHLNQDGSWIPLTDVDWTLNYGDVLVALSLLKQIGSPQNYKHISFGGINETKNTRGIIRGSTYLHNDFNFENANKSIDSIDGPVTIVGLGAQNPLQDVKFLDNNDDAKSFIARLNEKSASISVRGKFTADVLERLGAKSVRITGCPSLFYTGKCPEIKVSKLLETEHRRLGVSLHTGLDRNIFCRNLNDTLNAHHKLIEYAFNKSNHVSLFEQGVRWEFTASEPSYPYDERLQATQKMLSRLKSDLPETRVLSSMVSIRSVTEWLSKARDTDAILGFRFHGNMAALLQGIPCYYYVYDSRITEFCDLYKLPYSNVETLSNDPVQDIIDHDWDETNNALKKCYSEIKSFYQENGIANILA